MTWILDRDITIVRETAILYNTQILEATHYTIAASLLNPLGTKPALMVGDEGTLSVSALENARAFGRRRLCGSGGAPTAGSVCRERRGPVCSI